MPLNTDGSRKFNPTVEELCGWISADGADTPKMTEAEMARLVYNLSISLASRLRGRLDLNPVHREDATEAAHGAATHMRHVRSLLERQDAVTAEMENHRHEPVDQAKSKPAVDLGNDGLCMEMSASA